MPSTRPSPALTSITKISDVSVSATTNETRTCCVLASVKANRQMNTIVMTAPRMYGLMLRLRFSVEWLSLMLKL